MTKVLEQAEEWYESHESLLARANAVKTGASNSLGESITLSELEDAVSSAASDVSVDLEEALALKEIAERIRKWTERAGNAAPMKRSKRVGKGRWSCKGKRFRVEDLSELIDEAKSLPIPTTEVVDRLKKQLQDIQTWRSKAHEDLKEIADAFCCLRSTIDSIHGKSDELQPFLEIEIASDVEKAVEKSSNLPIESKVSKESVESCHDKDPSEVDESKPNTDELRSSSSPTCGFDEKNKVEYLISNLLNEARQTGVVTAEEDVINELDKIATWCGKSLKTLKNSSELLEKRTYQNFNSLVAAGKELLALPDSNPVDIDSDLSQSLRSSWSTLVEEQLCRLGKLEANRDDFIKWSKAAQNLMSAKEKKITIEDIEELALQSRKYPSCKL